MATWLPNYALGILIVVLYACDRFNTPPTNRSSTTAARYYTAAALYLGVAVGIYLVLLLGFPQLFNQWTAPVIEDYPWTKELSGPLLVAFLLTVSLPKVPILFSADEWIRKKLQHMAAIPFEVRRLSAVLRRSPFHVSDERQEEIRSGLVNEGFQATDILFNESAAPQYLWTMVAVLMKSLEDWESHSGFSGFIARFASELGGLRGRYKQLTPKAKSCFRLIREHPLGSGGGQAGDAVLQFQADFVEQAKDLLHSIFDFIGRGVLQCKLTHGARCNQLGSMGFQVQLPRPKLTVNELVALFMGVAGVLMFGFVRSQYAKHATGIGELFLMAMMIAAIYCVAIWWAIYPKGRWQCARWESGEIRPVACYVLAASLASATGLAINLAFKSVKLVMFPDPNLPNAWAAFQQAWPWTFMTFVTAFVTAWLTDDRPGVGFPAAGLRWLEGSVQAAMMMGAGWFVRSILNETGGQAAPSLGDVLLLSGIIGFGIGFLVPTWHREAPRRRDDGVDLGDDAMAKAVI